MSKRKEKKEDKEKEATPSKKGKKTKKDRGETPDKKKKEVDYSEIARNYKLPFKKINPHITCSICKGYLVDATTVIECLHTFCKACLLSHFEDEDNNCPKCNQLIHQSHPSHYVAFDRTMQDIVYKLVPGMFEEEKKRRLEFIRRQNKAEGKEEPEEDKTKDEPEVGSNNKCFVAKPIESHHRKDEQIVVELKPNKDLPRVARYIIRLSGMATVNTLKRYLSMCLYKDISQYNTLNIFCNNELMGRDYSMRFIEKTRCRSKPKDQPMLLEYRKLIEY